LKQSLSLCGIWYTESIHVWGWWYSQEYKMYSVMFRKIYLQWNFIVNFLIFKVEDFYFYLFKLFPKISYVQKIIFLLLPNIRSFACTEFHLEWLYHAFDHHHSNFFIFVIAEAEYCFWQDRLHVGWSEFFQTFFQTCKMLHVYIIEETKFCHWNCVLWMFNFQHKILLLKLEMKLTQW